MHCNMRSLVMIKKALVAVALLSVSAGSVSAYAADGLIGRGAPAATKANSAKKNGLVWVAIAGAVGGGIWLAADGGGSDGDSSPE
jgi:hypothetical protein